MGKKVMVMAGGTGGHIFPALAVANVLRERGVDIVWLGTPFGMEANLVPAEKLDLEVVEIGGIRGKGLLTKLTSPFRIISAMLQSAKIIRRVRPDVVIGFGGYVTGPAGIIARMLGLPLLVHEQNSIAGATNRILSRFATRVLQAFPGSLPASRAPLTTGNPVRSSIQAIVEPAQRFADRNGSLRVLVLGGSQGAQKINRVVPVWLAHQQGSVEVWHQAGERHLADTTAAYDAENVSGRVSAFIDDMAEAYAWADIVICRAGALTVSELAAAGVAAIFVPFPYAVDDHQTHNAMALVDRDAAILIPQEDFDAQSLADVMQPLIADRARLLVMAQQARTFGFRDATERVAQACLDSMPAGRVR